MMLGGFLTAPAVRLSAMIFTGIEDCDTSKSAAAHPKSGAHVVVIGSHSTMFVKRKVTPPDEELSTIFPSPSQSVCPSPDKQSILCDDWMISQKVLAGVRR